MNVHEIDERLEELREQICYLTYDRPLEDRTLDESVEDSIRKERLEAEYEELEQQRLELTRDEDSEFDY